VNVHLVVPLSAHSRGHEDLELRYMLRSVSRHFQDLCRVLIVGHRPAWLKMGNRLEHLACDDPHPRAKDANIIRKILKACEYLGEDFIVNSDDQIFCQDVHSRDLWNAWLDPAIDLERSSARRKSSLWHDRMLLTVDECKRRQWPEWVFEVHIPYPVDHEWYPRLMQGLDYSTGNGLLTHIYLNAYFAEGFPRRFSEPTASPKLLTTRLKRAITYNEARSALARYRFVNFNDAGFTAGMKQALEEKFPDPSPWE